METAHYIGLLTALVTGATAVAAACGGATDSSSSGAASSSSGGSSSSSSSGSSGGASSSSGTASSSGVVGGGCTNGTPQTYPVDASRCAPQLASTYSCNGQVCTWSVVEPCAPDAGTADAGSDAAAELPCLALCRAGAPPGMTAVTFCTMDRSDAATGASAQCGACGVGRPPRGFVARRAEAATPAGARLAEIAQLEAASVHAFRALYTDLARLHAPARLLRAVRAAGEDEVRHARAMRRAAIRYGAHVPRVRPRRARARTAAELAIENAEEGCVKETFGAALVAMQADAAADLRLRSTMRRIADDELRHAALSWELAAWLDRRLDARSRAAVAEARRATVSALEAELTCNAPAAPLLGLPDAARARRLLASMREALVTGDLGQRA